MPDHDWCSQMTRTTNEPTHVWVATRGGTVRHPVRPYNLPPEGKDGPKSPACRDRPIWVHVCTDEEMERLRPCYRCATIIREEEIESQMLSQLMRET